MIQRGHVDIDMVDRDSLALFVNMLSLRMIEVTKKDVQSSNTERRRFGRKFIKSHMFIHICDWADLDPDCTRENILRKNGCKRRNNHV